MLDQDTRTAILRLRREGHGIRTIARHMRISRNAVRRVLHSGTAEVPALEREESLWPHLHRIQQLYRACEGNRQRVFEELVAEKIAVSYSTLTAFCRRHGIGVTPKRRVGRYSFTPGQEMQHDTSPHTVMVGERRTALHCASVVFCYSRMLYAQAYPRWSRFECKLFLTDALSFFQGTAEACMVDNSSVVIARGAGADAVVAPEMKAFAERFGFRFLAHAVGHADRSARVERQFHYIEHNFYPGRRFESLKDLNRQLRLWCDQVNRRPKRALGASPREAFITEQPHLRPLPRYIQPVYEPYTRRVSVEGYVNLHTNRYSVPTAWIGRTLEVRETKDQVRIFDGHRLVATHTRIDRGKGQRSTLPEHQDAARWKRHRRTAPLPEEGALRTAAPELARLVDQIKRHDRAQAVRRLRQLYRIYVDYPLEVIRPAIATALDYGLLDLVRIEQMILRRLAGTYFRLPIDTEAHDER
jgi:transposase